MKKERLKLASAMLLLSGFSIGYIKAAPYRTEVYAVQQQGQTCTGVVVDQNGEAVIGASVVVKGTTNGIITGLDGDFSLSNVKKGDIIVVSYVGYENVEVKWEGRPLNIVLKEDSQTLDEIVVVGYGVQKKVNLTGAVSSVKGDALETRPVVDATQSLQGMVPGLQVSNSSSGRPGHRVH